MTGSLQRTSPETETLRTEIARAIVNPDAGPISFSKQIDAVMAIIERRGVAQTGQQPVVWRYRNGTTNPWFYIDWKPELHHAEVQALYATLSDTSRSRCG